MDIEHARHMGQLRFQLRREVLQGAEIGAANFREDWLTDGRPTRDFVH